MNLINFLTFGILFFFINSSCSFRQKTYSANDRIRHFQSIKLRTDQPVEVLWTRNLIPRIQAKNSKDLFYTLGAVQAHLRRNQLEMYRKLSKGAVSEMTGPVAIKIDRFLKSIDFEHAAKVSIKTMSKDSLDILKWLAKGINDYISQSKYRSKDLRIMNIVDKPWTVLDLVRVYKFTSVDVNWMVLAQLLEFKSTKFLEKVWSLKVSEKDFFDEFLKEHNLKNYEKLKDSKSDPISKALLDINMQDHSHTMDLSFLDQLQSTTKAGSNAFAVSGLNTISKSAIISNDPHLGLVIPNIWLFVVLDSPEYQTMGYVIPSFPVPVIGRNQNIGWGGTNLWGLSTFPVRLTDVEQTQVVETKKPLKVRFWPDQEISTYKLGDYPVFKASDFPQLGSEDIVFRWQGFKPSSELQAFLDVNRAKNFDEFHQAFESYGVAGMTFVFGDKLGNIGKLTALAQPQVKKLKVLYNSEDFSESLLTSKTLPLQYNPKLNFLVSANDYTKGLKQPMSLFQAPDDRKERMSFLLNSQTSFNLESVKSLHKDVFSATALSLKNSLVSYLKRTNWIKDSQMTNFKILAAWDGNYFVESKGALLFEVFLAAWSKDISDNLVLKDIKSKSLKNKAFNFLVKNFNYRKFLENSLTETSFFNKNKFQKYFTRAEFILNKYKSWGEFHQLDLRHPLGNLKVFKYHYSYTKAPWPGGNETLMKAAHKLSTRTGKVSFGAQARWMTDLSSNNENYMVYLGGQDGFIGSENMNDLTQVWKNGNYLRVPFDRVEFKKISANNGQ